MVEASRRTPVRGPTFVRLVARLIDADVAPTSTALAERLSLWIDWTRAVSLSRALDGATRTDDAGERGGGQPPAQPDDAAVQAQAEALAKAQRSLVAAITALPEPLPALDAGYAPWRQRYQSQQRAMQAACGRLRGSLRDLVASQGGDKARLADIDGVMEVVLVAREQRLLAAVPGLLGMHYDRLRQAAQAAAGDAPADTAWCTQFAQDMREVALAELDVRFQPLHGLLAAART